MKKYFFLSYSLFLMGLSVKAQSWNPVSGNGINGIVNSMIAYDSVLYVGGNGFDTAGGVYLQAKYIAQYNGTTWSGIPNSRNYINGTVNAMIVYRGKLYVGGWFSTTGVYCWDGVSWSEPFGTSATVRAFTIYNNKLVFSGDFTSVGGVGNANNIAQWDGSSCSTVGVGNEFSNSIYALTVYNGNLIAAGAFDWFGSIRTSIVQWNSSTGWSTIGATGYPDAQINALGVYNGDLYAGISDLYFWNGTVWSYTTVGSAAPIACINTYNNNLIIGGYFSSIDSKSIYAVGEYNSTTWSSLGSNVLTGWPNSFALYNGALYAGGEFGAASGNHNVRGIAVLSGLNASLSSQNNITCFNSCNGDAAVTASSGTPPYTYSWSAGGTNSNTSNLCAGSYTCTVTDAYVNDTVNITVTITQPAQIRDSIVASKLLDNKCFNGSDGSATLGVKGGTLPYTFSWTDNVSTTASASNLKAGNYTVIMSDSKGCSETAIVSITQPTTALSITHDSVNATSSCNGIAGVQVHGGISPYTYYWSAGHTNDTINNKCAGTYTCVITDNNGCSHIAAVIVKNTTGIENISSSASVNIYPDPNTGYFTAAGLKQGQVIELYNYMGQMMSSFIANAMTMHFDISTKANGIYFLRILNKDGSVVMQQKILKTN